MAKQTSDNLFLPVMAGVCGWLIPGAGYWLIGERKRALVIAIAITALFVTGLYIGSIGVIDPVNETLSFYAQILASPAVFYLDHLSRQMWQASGHTTQFESQKRLLVFARPNEIGQIYTSVAGMLNLLCVLTTILMADAKLNKKGE
jgi:hypothetical protein